MNQMFWIVSWQKIAYDNVQVDQKNPLQFAQEDSFEVVAGKYDKAGLCAVGCS